MRSKVLHEEWMAALPCKVLRLEGDLSVEERVADVIAEFQGDLHDITKIKWRESN